MLDLGGRTAIVTGASRGIGRAIAAALAARGAFVVAAARGSNAAGTVDAITAAGGSAEAAALDVTDPASIDRLVTSVLERRGRIDILVNNAGITRDQLMLRMKRDDWDAVVRRLASEGVTTYVEVGPGTVLSGLVQKLHTDARVIHFGSPEDLGAVMAAC